MVGLRYGGGGALDRRIQFQRATLSDDGLSRVETWANFGDPVPASRNDISDGERWRAGEVQAHVSTRFVVRFSAFTASISPKDRLICEGETFDISGIKQVGRRNRLEITAAARADL